MPKRKLEPNDDQSQNNQIAEASDVIKKLKPQSKIERLLEKLENLKSNKTQISVNLGNLFTDDEPEKANDIRTKIIELMAINHTVQSLSLSFTYMHKRVCRELVVYTENDAIKIKLINGDNSFNHGEFSVPGFSEIDAVYDEATYEPVFSKIVEVFDRSNIIKFAFLKEQQLSFFKSPIYEEGMEQIIFDYMRPKQ